MQRTHTIKSFKLKRENYIVDFLSYPIGDGASSYVYLGEYIDKKTKEHKPAAIKHCKWPKYIKQFEHERDILQSIANQPNENSKYIITYYGARFYTGLLGLKEADLVMEYANGGDLEKWIETSGVKDWTVKLSLVKGIARGVYFLHSINIIHHDINRVNIFLHNENGELVPKISDLGFAIAKNDKIEYGIGTIPYLPPEVFTKSEPFSDKSDIYSLGLVFWEVAALQFIYKQIKNEYALIKHVVNYQLRDHFPEGCPPAFWYLINWMWQQNPADRPTMKQVLEQLLIGLDNISSQLYLSTLFFEMHTLAVKILKNIFMEITQDRELSNDPGKEIYNYDEKLEIFSDVFSKVITTQFSDDYLLNMSDSEKNRIQNSIANIFITNFKQSLQPYKSTYHDFIKWQADLFNQNEADKVLENYISLGIQHSQKERKRKYFAIKQVLMKFSIFEPLKQTAKLKDMVSVSLDMKCSR